MPRSTERKNAFTIRLIWSRPTTRTYVMGVMIGIISLELPCSASLRKGNSCFNREMAIQKSD